MYIQRERLEEREGGRERERERGRERKRESLYIPFRLITP